MLLSILGIIALTVGLVLKLPKSFSRAGLSLIPFTSLILIIAIIANFIISYYGYRGICSIYEKVQRDYYNLTYNDTGSIIMDSNNEFKAHLLKGVLRTNESKIINTISGNSFMMMNPSYGDSIMQGIIQPAEDVSEYMNLYDYQCMFDKVLIDWLRGSTDIQSMNSSRSFYIYYGLLGQGMQEPFIRSRGIDLANAIYDNKSIHSLLFNKLEPHIRAVLSVSDERYRVYWKDILLEWRSWCREPQKDIDDSDIRPLQEWTIRRISKNQFTMDEIVYWIDTILNEFFDEKY